MALLVNTYYKKPHSHGNNVVQFYEAKSVVSKPRTRIMIKNGLKKKEEKELGLLMLVGLLQFVHSPALSHYCLTRAL